MSLRLKRSTAFGAARLGAHADTYAALIQADTPFAYWRLDETSGSTAKDSSGNGHDGSYGGGFTLGYGSTNLGRAAKFDGTNGTMEVASNGAVTWFSSSYSLECWVAYSVFVGTTQPHTVMTPKYSGTGNLGPMLGYDIDGSNVGKLQGGHFTGSFIMKTDPTARTANVFYHQVVTYDGTTLKLYVNGASVASGAVSAPGAPSDHPAFRLAQRWDSGGTENFTACQMQHAAVYAYALSAAQISAHFALA